MITPPSTSGTAGQTPQREYSAFISYRHADNEQEGRRWANWLHAAMESFEISPRLAGTVDRDGGCVPTTLFPVFRDEKELAGDASLDRAIENALDHSRALVLIASPRAAKSPHVNREVEYFAALGKANRIITVVIDGVPDKARKPGAEGEEAMPPALLRLQPGGLGEAATEDSAATPRSGALWVDLRPPAVGGAAAEEGWTSMGSYADHLVRVKGMKHDQARKLARAYAAKLREQQLRIIAGVLNVSYGALARETDEYAVRRLRRVLFATGAALALFIGLAWIANEQRLEAVRQRRSAVHAARA